ncbi:MAG: addiction module protein [Gemmataceae bacterium]|nr:addiction module protein [Gemmataceae bacterium]
MPKLWERSAEDEEAAPLAIAQRAELERRLAHSIAHPDAVVSWEVVKAKALARVAQNRI